MIQIDLSAKRAKNLAALQKIDNRALEIISETSHTCIYKFNAATTQWERYGVEGAGFIVRNCGAPFYSFIVMNKVGIDDFTLDMSKVQKAKIQDSYIMLRCSTDVR
jgi:Dcp1-like decapping family